MPFTSEHRHPKSRVAPAPKVCRERTPNTSGVIPDLIGDLLVSRAALFEFGVPVFPKTKQVACCEVYWIPDQVGDDTRGRDRGQCPSCRPG